MSEAITFQVNSQKYTERCSPGTSLLSLLRQLGWAGVHRVCETGDCGSCTVWVDGSPIHSCLYPAVRSQNRTITTIEGLAQDGLLPMQQAFLEKQGFQCGFCTPGMIMSAEKMTMKSEADLRSSLRGNLCRCTGYEAIVESIQLGHELVEKKAGGLFLCKGAGVKLPLPSSLKPLSLDTEVEEVGKERVDDTSKTSLFEAPAFRHESPLPPSPQIRQSIPKQDGPDLVTGKPVYTSDWAPPGLLHLKVLRSPHPHARICQIRTEKAKALSGVHAVLTYKDVPRRAYSTAGHSDPIPDPLDHYILDTKVRFIGDRVAAVVAESVAIAEQACRCIEVDYEILPHVIDPAEAMGAGIIIHDEPESSQIYDTQHNIAGRVFLESGDLGQGFAEADLVMETSYQLPPVQHTHLEPHVSISWFDEDGTLVVRSSTQVPFHCQRLLSEIFDLPKEKFESTKPNWVADLATSRILSPKTCVF